MSKRPSQPLSNSLIMAYSTLFVAAFWYVCDCVSRNSYRGVYLCCSVLCEVGYRVASFIKCPLHSPGRPPLPRVPGVVHCYMHPATSHGALGWHTCSCPALLQTFLAFWPGQMVHTVSDFCRALSSLAAMNLASAGTNQVGLDFLAENKNKEGVITLASGMQYKVLRKGQC